MPPGDLFTQQGADQHALDCSATTPLFGFLVMVILCLRCHHWPGASAQVSVEGKPKVSLTTGQFGISKTFPAAFSLGTGTKSERNFPPQRKP